MTPRRPARRPATVGALSVAALAAGLLIVPQQASADQISIHDIQGSTRISPLAGQAVSGVPGIVTGVRTTGSSKGFWMQDPHPDDDPATSEGIFVYTSSAPKVALGDSVTVDGTVNEYYPGGSDTGVQSVTEIDKATVTVVSSGNPLPAPVVLDSKDIPAAYAPDAAGGDIDPLTLRPDTYALDLFESLEGMNVEVDDARVVGPTDAYGELWVTAKPRQNPTARGGTIYEGYDDPNDGRLQIQSDIPASQSAFPQANVGDELAGATTGPLDFNQYGGYTIVANTLGTLTSGGLTPEVTRKQGRHQLALATYNVENLAPGDPDSKFAALAKGVVDNLRSPDIVALEEIQDNDGATDDGVVDCDKTVAKFVDAVKAAGGPAYDWRSINPVNDKDGGEPGGNIRSVFLFNPDRVSFDDIPGGGPTSAVGVTAVHGQAQLTASPGRVEPNDSAWTDSRKPLVGQFTFQGKRVFVIANHFVAKLGDQPMDSRFQPPTQSSMVQRIQQAQVENGFVKQILSVDKHAEVIALGDLNDFQFSPALSALTDGGVLKDLMTTLPVKQRYSYDYEGNSEALDHILTSPAVHDPRYDVVHVNAEFAHQTSDHDPQVVRVRP